MMAGDNPIYALSSDTVIPISVPYSRNSARRDYINVYPAPSRHSSSCIDEQNKSCSVELTSGKSSQSAEETNVRVQEASAPHLASGGMQPSCHTAKSTEQSCDVHHSSGAGSCQTAEPSVTAKRNCYENVYT